MAKKFLSLWIPVILWSSLIFYLSSLRLKPPTGNIFFDLILPNLAHLAEFGILFALILRATRSVSVSFFLAIIYAFSDEFHQVFVPTRTPDVIDILVDIIGMTLAWIVIWKLLPKAPKRLLNLAKNWQII